MAEEQNINGLPKDWKKMKLGEVANYINGKAFKPSEWSDTGLPIIRIQNLNRINSTYNYCNFEVDKKFFVNDGDLLFAWSGTPDTSFGAHIWKGEKAVLNQHIFRIEINEDKIDKKFYLHALNNKVKEFVSKAHGTAGLAHITKKKFEEAEIIVPPIPQQKQIVSKIEELLSELDKGIEELKTAQQQLKVYRQAVLKWAFEGRLTNEVVKDSELPKGWTNATIGDVCTGVEYGSASKSKATGKIPVLRMGNIQNGIFDWEDLVYTDDEEEINKYSLRKNDVLFNRTNSAELVGKTAIYKGERPAIFAGYLIRINRIEEQIDANYLTYYLNSKEAKRYGNSVRSFGVNQSNINGTKLKTYPLPLPPLGEQQKIVQEIESRLSVCDKIEETINDSLKQADALRQSILKKAFEGKLLS
jgi:type I restriction enzyme, S subunit